KTESPFSHNSITDFTHNMVGAKNVYLCTVNGATGASLSALVSSRNLSLNNTIIAKFDAAITALNTVNATFEYAIYNRRVQLQNAMTAINDLHEVLDHDLKNHIITYVKD
ncbi:MAG: hypothetical protein EBZ77_14910, partial [Chitinophagia bacterium]|nr:hypothetical protein [Chitinophagia bacterium]